MDELFARYGYYEEKLYTIAFENREGQEKIQALINNLRRNYQKLLPMDSLAFFEDYQFSKRIDCRTNGMELLTLPQSNVLKFIFDDGSWLTLRPSGTEPKIKIYISAVGLNKRSAGDRLQALNDLANGFCDRED